MHAVRIMSLAALIAFFGCGPAAPKVAKVSGTVNFDGAPLAAGEIMFAPATGAVPTLAAINNGKYELEALAGKNRVEIRAMRLARNAPKNTGGPGSENAGKDENYIPDRYNDNSSLSADVPVIGSNSLNFDLKK